MEEKPVYNKIVTFANKGGGGYGVGSSKSKPATGMNPASNPFMLPKETGLGLISQFYPPNYFQEWDISRCRMAYDKAMKQGFTNDLGTLYQWTYESSSFVRSLFAALKAAIDRVEFYIVDTKGNKMDPWTVELCNKRWARKLNREIIYSYLWGFTGINIDILNNQCYKYPIAQIDPINQFLKNHTYDFYNGINFDEADNLIFIQPSSNYEEFLGWMQPISRDFVQINQNNINWLMAGQRAAVPNMVVGYPEDSSALDPDTGTAYNPHKRQAESIAANTRPQDAIVVPYAESADGKIQKAIDVEFTQPKGNMNMHKIFQEFNADKKNEIREMIFGGTLTSDAGKFGTKGLGEVHQDKWDAVVEGMLEDILAEKNDNQLPKIKRFYRNFPEGAKYEVSREKKYKPEEIKALSESVRANGKKLTDKFFIDNGLPQEYFEEAPTPTPTPSTPPTEMSVQIAAQKKKTFLNRF